MVNMFYKNQISYPRVEEALRQKEQTIAEHFKKADIDYPSEQIYIRVLKHEKLLELWAKDKNSINFSHIKSYNMTGFSGGLGPKRKEGDGQIPEGFYHVNRFNPSSKYHLSLCIDYPNELDRIIGDSQNPGKDIFIHGGERTVGCVPIGDENIKELYIIAASVCCPFDIKVHIFPSKLDDAGFSWLKAQYGEDHELISFWESLKEGYDLFERNRVPADTAPGNCGSYIFI